MKALQSQMEVTSKQLSDEALTASAKLTLNGNEQVIYVASDNGLNMLDSAGMGSEAFLPMTFDESIGSPLMIKTCKALNNTVLSVDTNGILHVVCSLTLLTLDLWNEVSYMNVPQNTTLHHVLKKFRNLSRTLWSWKTPATGTSRS